MIRAALFDFDGVLVDSMGYHVRAWKEVFSEYGVEVNPREVLLREGSRSQGVAWGIVDDHKLDISPEVLQDLVQRKQQIYRANTCAAVQPGADRLLQTLKEAGLKLGLVTGSTADNVREVLSEDMLAQFDVIVTADDVQEGKPNPEPFLKAAGSLEVEPEHCLVIENAPLGIRAARAAGMWVIALTTTLGPVDLPNADEYVSDLGTLRERWPALQAKFEEIHG